MERPDCKDATKEVALLRKKLARAETRYRQATEANYRLAMALELSKDILCVLDAKGRLLYMNEAGYALLDVTAEEQEGKPFFPNYATWAREVIITQALPQAAKRGFWEGTLALSCKQTEVAINQQIRAHRTASGDTFFCSQLRIKNEAEEAKNAALRGD